MKKIVLLALFAVILSTVAMAGHQVAVLDGTSWKVDVGPDAMAKQKGEKDYNEVLTFADGMVSMKEGQKVGFASSHYEVAKSGDKDWTFKSAQDSQSVGQAVWTGTIHEKNIDGKMIMTRKDGSVLTYTFKGNKLD